MGRGGQLRVLHFAGSHPTLQGLGFSVRLPAGSPPPLSRSARFRVRVCCPTPTGSHTALCSRSASSQCCQPCNSAHTLCPPPPGQSRPLRPLFLHASNPPNPKPYQQAAGDIQALQLRSPECLGERRDALATCSVWREGWQFLGRLELLAHGKPPEWPSPDTAICPFKAAPRPRSQRLPLPSCMTHHLSPIEWAFCSTLCCRPPTTALLFHSPSSSPPIIAAPQAPCTHPPPPPPPRTYPP